MMEQMQEALQEAMSAKGDLLCLDECASVLVAKEIEKRTDDELELLKSETAGATLARLELALAGTDPSVNREVIRLKLEIARLRHEGVSEEVCAREPCSAVCDTHCNLRRWMRDVQRMRFHVSAF